MPDMPRVTGASRSNSARRRALGRLDGQRLIAVSVVHTTGLTRLIFDLGAVLEIRRVSAAEPDEMWLLYKPSGYVLAVRGRGEYDHRRGTSTAQPQWRAIRARA